MPSFNYDGAYHDPNLPIVNGDNTFGNAITTPYDGPGLPAVGTEVYSILMHFDPDLSGVPFNLNEGIGDKQPFPSIVQSSEFMSQVGH